MNYENDDFHNLRSDKGMLVNEAFIVPYQRTSRLGGNKSLDATCSLLTAIIGLLKASEVRIN